MTPIVVKRHPDMKSGTTAYPVKPIRYSGAWRPASRALAQYEVTTGEPTDVQRIAQVGILAVGLFTAFLAWPHRKKFGGAVALSAGSGAIGVGLAFLTLDLIGFRPGGSSESL